jgi:hypothetical protein
MNNETRTLKEKKENPLLNIALNILLPVWVLNAGSKYDHPWAAEVALGLGLMFPIIYGLWDYRTNGRRNFVSLLGVFNVLLTGGFALFELTPFWFVVKEAIFPLVLGLGVLSSQWIGKQAFFEMIVRNSGSLDFTKVDTRVNELGIASRMNSLFRKSNMLFASSFFVSALLNLLLATKVFISIPTDLPTAQRKLLLNEQIAQMTWKGWVVIALPLTLFMMVIFWFFFKRLKVLTGLDLDDLAKS